MYSILLYCHVMYSILTILSWNSLVLRWLWGQWSLPLQVTIWTQEELALREEEIPFLQWDDDRSNVEAWRRKTEGSSWSRRDVEEKRCSTYIVSGESIESNSPVGRETTAHMNGGGQERERESDQVCQPGRSSENLWSSWSWAPGKISPQTLTRLSLSPSPSLPPEALKDMREKYEMFYWQTELTVEYLGSRCTVKPDRSSGTLNVMQPPYSMLVYRARIIL